MSRRPETIWLFAGGPMQAPAALKIRQRGYRLVVTDRDPACACAPLAHELIIRDTFDIPGNVAQLPRLRRQLDIRAVLTVAADCHETVAAVSRELGLPGLAPSLAHACRHKLETRTVLSRAGLPQPRFFHVFTTEEARIAVGAIHGPAVIKASDSSGSRGLSKVRHPDEVRPEMVDKAVNAGSTGYCLVEECLQPLTAELAEQSVETLWHEGRMYWLNWVDRLFRADLSLFPDIDMQLPGERGWGVELGHLNPAVHEPRTRRAVAGQILRAGHALGMHRQRGGHILKADIMLTPRGPYILELTPRLSGGWDSSLSTPLRGADFIGGVMELALGRTLDPGMWHACFAYQEPALHAAVLAVIGAGATDCMDRRFAGGTGYTRHEALTRALGQLKEEHFVLPLEQPLSAADPLRQR